MELDGKMTIGSGEVTTFGNPEKLCEKALLIIEGADVFDDGVGVGDSKGVVRKRQDTTITRNGRYERVTFTEGQKITLRPESDGGDVFRMEVEFFKVVIGG